MIDPATVGEIIRQYEKHGWKLRRALLSDEARERFSGELGEIDVIESDVDALWFWRKSKPESETWELRRLSALPYALVAVVPTDSDEDEVESTLEQVLDEMRAKTMA